MNTFITKLTNIAISNKYTKWYISIINNALLRQNTVYVERHHIIPKSFSIELCISEINSAENIVELSAKEHFICHRLLTKMFTGLLKRKMTYAIHRLTYSNNHNKSGIYVSSRHYVIVRKQHSTNMSGVGNPMYGHLHTEETKEKIRIKATGRKASQELKEFFSQIRNGSGNPMYGRNHTSMSKDKMSTSQKGKHVGEQNSFYGMTHSAETKLIISNLRKSEPRVECIYCSKITSKLNNIRWHNDKCKFRDS